MKRISQFMLATSLIVAASFGTSCKKETPEIKEPQPIEIGSFKLIADKTNLEIGDELTIEAKIKPAEAAELELIWTSEEPEIISVDNNGKISALRFGTSKITATIKQGEMEESASLDFSVNSDLEVKIESGNQFWGDYKKLKAVKKGTEEERQVEWTVSYPELEAGKKSDCMVNENNELIAMPLTDDSGNFIYNNYKVKIEAVAKDNGSVASLETDIYWWNITVWKDLMGGKASPDHIFRSNEDIYLSFSTGLGVNYKAKDLGITITYDENKIRKVSDDDVDTFSHWYVKNDISGEVSSTDIECSNGLILTRVVTVKVQK